MDIIDVELDMSVQTRAYLNLTQFKQTTTGLNRLFYRNTVLSIWLNQTWSQWLDDLVKFGNELVFGVVRVCSTRIALGKDMDS